MDFKGPTIEPEDNRMSSMLDSAKIFSEIWETGSSLAGLCNITCVAHVGIDAREIGLRGL